MKDTQLQMLTTRSEELKMNEDESFDSFYAKLNEVVIRSSTWVRRGKTQRSKKDPSIIARKLLCKGYSN